MNSEVHPIVVALVLFLTVVAIGIWMWGSGAATRIGGPAELRSGPNGHHYIQIQNYLVEHDEDGKFVATHDLGSLGVELFLGTYAFFSNGDILLRRGPDPRSFSDNVRAFQRQTNRSSTVPESADSGLFRCSLETSECTRFGSPGVDFKAAHGIHIDWRTDDVYVSDTTRHLLRKYSADGEEVAVTEATFKFPNQVLLHNERLYVADTNNHVIRVVESDTASYGSLIESRYVVPGAATLASQKWPSHFVRVGDDWWVNNMKTGMNLGGLYVFDSEWDFRRPVDLPNDADPISLLAVDDEVWVSDWNNDLVRRFSRDGRSLTPLESAGLEDILVRSRSERRQYEIYSYGGIALVVFVLAALLVRGFAVSMNKDSRQEADASADAPMSSDGLLYLEPDPKALRRMRFATMAFGTLLLMLVATVGMILLTYDIAEKGVYLIVPVAGLLLVFASIVWIQKANRGTAIRLEGDTLTLRDHLGRESSCSVHQVRYADSAIATRDAVVFLGRPMAWVYPRELVENELLPRLTNAEKINPLQMTRILIDLQHPQGVVTILSFVGAVVLAIWVLLQEIP